MTVQIIAFTAEQMQTHLSEFVELLRDAVDTGASVGFMPPLSTAEAEAFWQGIIADIQTGSRVVLVAKLDDTIAGSVQLGLAQKPNARHRAEVQKLLVHTRYRRRGIGTQLMLALEDSARQYGRTLLVLDTIKGDAAEQLYPKMGYVRLGEIPQFAMIVDGTLAATVIFYKVLSA
jgi:GNAT superfamily N-acetyltransferase